MMSLRSTIECIREIRAASYNKVLAESQTKEIKLGSKVQGSRVYRLELFQGSNFSTCEPRTLNIESSVACLFS